MIGPEGQRVLRQYMTTDLNAYFGPAGGSRPYRRDSYTTAIKRGCRSAEIEPWSPNQLRHTFATRARRAAGLEGSRVVLGHSSAAVTELYAERDMEAARQVVARIG